MELQGNNFGERLLEARKAKEFTRENLAKLVHISSKTERYPTIDIASRLAAALDVSVASLLGEEGEIIEKARKDFGSKGVRDMRELIDDVTGLFAGGELPEEDKDALMRAFSDAYFTAKEKNNRFTPKKYRKN